MIGAGPTLHDRAELSPDATKNYPSRQKAASFNLDEVMRNLTESQAK
jgi:hypothetical protein